MTAWQLLDCIQYIARAYFDQIQIFLNRDFPGKVGLVTPIIIYIIEYLGLLSHREKEDQITLSTW